MKTLEMPKPKEEKILTKVTLSECVNPYSGYLSSYEGPNRAAVARARQTI